MKTRPFGTKNIKSGEELWMHFLNYEKETKQHPYLVKDWVGKDGMEVYREKEKPLSLEGFERYLAKTDIINDISDYLENKNGAYDDYVSTVKAIRACTRADQIDGAMAGMYAPGIAARLNGLVDKIENTNRNVPILNLDPIAPADNSTP